MLEQKPHHPLRSHSGRAENSRSVLLFLYLGIYAPGRAAALPPGPWGTKGSGFACCGGTGGGRCCTSTARQSCGRTFKSPASPPFLQRMGYALQPEIALGQLEQKAGPAARLPPMRSASSWAIPWRTWWASWKTEVRIASTPVAGRSIPTWPRPGSDSPSLNGASPFMRFNFRGKDPFTAHGSRFPPS